MTDKRKGKRAKNSLDLTGKKFNMLTVISYKGTRKGRAYWNCVCDCGNECEATTNDLTSLKRKSCGCQKYRGFTHEIKDISGRRFGRLVVVGQAGKTPGGKILWECKCDCGRTTYSTKDHLGRDKNSCGCIKTEMLRKRWGTHGESGTRLHNLWCSMRQRCTENGVERNVYYDRGITVCDEWNDYETFRDWALSHGYDPEAERGETTIDRIDNNKGYSPDNCRFVTQKENARNKRNMIMVTVNGETMPLTEAAEKYGKNAKLARERILRGWNPEKALLTPARKGRYKHDGDKRVANY